MKVAIVEKGGELTKLLEAELSKRIETISFEHKKALDLFDVLAYARKMIALDQVILIAQLIPEEQDLNKIFFAGLASLEGETGKNMFKCFYEEDEDTEQRIKDLAELFFNYLFHPEKLSEKKEKPDEYFGMSPI